MTGYIIAETIWEKARLGKFTSSEIDKLFTLAQSRKARLAGELGGTARTYINSRAAEIITGTMRQVTNWNMEWGNYWEPVAAEKLAAHFPGMEYLGKNNPRFIRYTDFSGGSPDGWHIARKLVFEIKCPSNPENHIENCLLRTSAQLKAKRRAHYHQLQMNMICVAKEFGIPFHEMRGVYCSYCPTVRDGYQDLFLLEIEPDMEFYAQLGIVLDRTENLLADIVWSLERANCPSGLILQHNPVTNASVIEEWNAQETDGPVDHFYTNYQIATRQ